METNIEKLLNVKKGEQFTIRTREDEYFKLGAIGELVVYDKESQTWHDENVYHFAEILNHPEYIIRRPALTAEQREVLEWLHKGGFKWVTRDKFGDVEAHKSDGVTINEQCWIATTEDHSIVIGTNVELLRPLIPDWKTALDIAATLRDAGVGV